MGTVESAILICMEALPAALSVCTTTYGYQSMAGVILNAISMTGVAPNLFLELVLTLAAEKTMEIVVTLDLSVRAAS
jgi:hypothetical protein